MCSHTAIQLATLSTVLATIAAVGASPLAETVYFQVYNDSQCTQKALPDAPAFNMTIEKCYVFSYTDPAGKVQTNANGYFYCADDTVTWTQWPGSDSCTPPASALCINATLSTSCKPVETHTGLTYQKLLNYAVPCTSKVTGPRCP